MAPEHVYLMRPEFQSYLWKNFKVNLKSLCATVASDPSAGAPPKWKDSEGKEQLKKDIVLGLVPATMEVREVYNMHHQLYQAYKFWNFTTSLKNLREAIALDHARMVEDAGWYGYDVSIIRSLAEPDYLPWHKSPTATLLAQDVANGMQRLYTPMQMHAMRQEYQVFTLYQFRKFVNQEVDKEGKKEARFLKKQKKEAKKLKRRTGLSRAEQG
jgi:hypothetical protein